MKSMMQCTICSSKWSLDPGEGFESWMAHCPICTSNELNDSKLEVERLNKLLKCYRVAFADSGVREIPIDEE